ncbi:13482_t:CDS:2, partial [Cetraspora pellucida]
MSMYCNAQINGQPIILILNSSSSGCVVFAGFLKNVRMTINCPLIVIMVGVHGKQKRPLGEIEEFPVTVGGKTITSQAVVTDVRNYTVIKIKVSTEYCSEDNVLSYKEGDRCLAKLHIEEKKTNDFKLEDMTPEQHDQIKGILSQYEDIFTCEPDQLEFLEHKISGKGITPTVTKVAADDIRFVLYTDTSQLALGAVLSQPGDNELEGVV